MTPALRFAATSWTFLWRQPALGRVAALLAFLPLVVMYTLDVSVGGTPAEQTAVIVVLFLAAYALLTWGTACTLVVGKRLLQAKAGRTRTSFKAVQGQARGFVAPLLLTDILRACIALFWSLPAVGLGLFAMTELQITYLTNDPFDDARAYWYLAGVCALLLLPLAYLALTVLAPQAVVYEKLSPRQALARSRKLLLPRAARSLGVLILLALLWLPGMAAEILIGDYVDPAVATFILPITIALLDTFALVLWTLSLTQYYKALGGKAKATKEDDE
jgi:hypothetical protein